MMAFDLLYFGLCFLAAWLLIGSVRAYVARRGVVDRPNDRTSHELPTPRGGGLGFMPVILLGWLLFSDLFPVEEEAFHMTVFMGAILVVYASWIDDIRSLPVIVRFCVHILVTAIPVFMVTEHYSLTDGVVPQMIERVFLILVWVWFINLFNFMDGTDGISAVQGMFIALGVMGVSAAGFYYLPMVVCAGLLAFLLYNRPPASIFMGDSGSIGLGYILGYMLLMLALKGYWMQALVIPGYYLADAGLTLLKRILAKQKFWQAHREHYYQRAAGNQAKGHRRVLRVVIAGNILLLVLVSEITSIWLLFVCAVAVVSFMLVVLELMARARLRKRLQL